MENQDLFRSLNNNASTIKEYISRVRSVVHWIKMNLPMEEELREVGRFMLDSNGEVFLYYNGIYYSWQRILSILRKQEMVTIDSLYE